MIQSKHLFQFFRLNIICFIICANILSCANDKEREIEKTIFAYFANWSSNNMPAYADSFHPAAIIHFVQSDNSILVTPLPVFLAEQRELRSEGIATEVPLRTQIFIAGQQAHAIVKWELRSQDGLSSGYDHFIFVMQNGKWKISYLIWKID